MSLPPQDTPDKGNPIVPNGNGSYRTVTQVLAAIAIAQAIGLDTMHLSDLCDQTLAAGNATLLVVLIAFERQD